MAFVEQVLPTDNKRLTMDEPILRSLFLQSVNRCLDCEEFLPAFYERFLGASDEIRSKFRFTDFNRQHRMLRRSLELCAGALSNKPEALCEIHERAATHDRDHLNIEPWHYDAWLEAMIGTACDVDDQWSEAVEAEWRKVLGHVVQHMIRRY